MQSASFVLKISQYKTLNSAIVFFVLKLWLILIHSDGVMLLLVLIQTINDRLQQERIEKYFVCYTLV